MLRCVFATLGLLTGGLAGGVAAFFGVGSVVEGGLIGVIVGVLLGWRLDKRRNREHRTWKGILGALGWPLGGLAGVAALRAWCLYGQTRFSEEDLVDGFFLQFSVAIVVLGLMGAITGVIVGVLLGWRLDKHQNAGDRDHHRRHRIARVCVNVGAAIVGLALGVHCYRFVARTLSGPPDAIRVVFLHMKLGAEPDQAETVVSELIRIGTDSERPDGIRKIALDYLDDIGPEGKAAVPALIHGLENSSSDVRYHCAAALGRIGPDAKSAVPQLTKALQDKEPNVRQIAADSLAKIQTDDDVERTSSQSSKERTAAEPSAVAEPESAAEEPAHGPTVQNAMRAADTPLFGSVAENDPFVDISRDGKLLATGTIPKKIVPFENNLPDLRLWELPALRERSIVFLGRQDFDHRGCRRDACLGRGNRQGDPHAG